MTARVQCSSCAFFIEGRGVITCLNNALAEQFAPQMANREQLIQFMKPAPTDRCSLHQPKVQK